MEIILTVFLYVVGLSLGMFIGHKIGELFDDEPIVGTLIKIALVIFLLVFACWNEGLI